MHERKRRQRINQNIDFKTYWEMYDRVYKYSHKSLFDLIRAIKYNLIFIVQDSRKMPHQFVSALLKYLRPDFQQIGDENDGISYLISEYQLSYATLKNAHKDLLTAISDRNFHLFMKSLIERFDKMRETYYVCDKALYNFTKSVQENLGSRKNAQNPAPRRLDPIHPTSIKEITILDENDPDPIKQWPIGDRLWLNIMKLDKHTNIISSCNNSELKFHLLHEFIKSRPALDDSEIAKANFGSKVLEQFDKSMQQFKDFLCSDQLNALENKILNKLKSESERLSKEKFGQAKKRPNR